MDVTETLRCLREAANDACDQAREIFEDVFETRAANWARLWCYAAHYVIPDEGDPFYEVRIAEADPACPRFQAWVREKLREAGFDDVEVLTEW